MIKLDLTPHEVYCLHDILLNLFHKTDCNKPVHSLLGYHDFVLIQKIAHQTRQHQVYRKNMTPIFIEYFDWPKQPLTNQFTDGQHAVIEQYNEDTKQ